jgi:hypothetical protein
VTIKSLPAALAMMKAMQAEGVEWGEAYRAGARPALAELLEGRMAQLIDEHLERMAELGQADQRNGGYTRWLLTELGMIGVVRVPIGAANVGHLDPLPAQIRAPQRLSGHGHADQRDQDVAGKTHASDLRRSAAERLAQHEIGGRDHDRRRQKVERRSAGPSQSHYDPGMATLTSRRNAPDNIGSTPAGLGHSRVQLGSPPIVNQMLHG